MDNQIRFLVLDCDVPDHSEAFGVRWTDRQINDIVVVIDRLGLVEEGCDQVGKVTGGDRRLADLIIPWHLGLPFL